MSGHRRPPPLRVALPWWDAALRDARESGAAPDLPAMRWLQARAAREVPLTTSWRDWLLGGTGLAVPATRCFAAGPSVRAATGRGTLAGDCWAVAQPVHLATAIDHLRMGPLHDLAVADEEAAELCATLRVQLAGMGIDIECSAPGAWSLRSVAPVDCTTFEPAELVGQNVADYLPGGRDGRAIRRLMNEIQMLLHEHVVNQRRARDGRPMLNSLWLWGFGVATPATHRPLPAMATDDPWLAGIWQQHGQPVVASAADSVGLVARAAPGDLVARTQPAVRHAAQALQQIDETLLGAARQAVAGGRGALEICTGSRIVALDLRSRWRFWRSSSPRDAQHA